MKRLLTDFGSERVINNFIAPQRTRRGLSSFLDVAKDQLFSDEENGGEGMEIEANHTSAEFSAEQYEQFKC